MTKIKTLLGFFIKAGIICAVFGVLILAGGFFYLKPQLPDVDQLRDIELQTPLRIYSADRKLIAEFGEMRRTPVSFDEIPEQFVQAILAAEDGRFYSHDGIDYIGLGRAAFQLLSTGHIQTGGSTITMQVARNYLLTLERTFIRKFKEIIIALQMEQQLTKNEILELYVNKIYLGNRAYGIQAAAHVYYGRDIDELSLAELAMIAGLPKAPSAYNPLINPPRALERRDWILSRMLSLGYIDATQFAAAIAAPITAVYHGTDIELYAPYVAEMVRSHLLELYGERIYAQGYSVYTTLDSGDQQAANSAVEKGLMDYELRHGYRGAEQQFPAELEPGAWLEGLREVPTYASLEPAVVVEVSEQSARLLRADAEIVDLSWEGISWARPYLSAYSRGPKPKMAADVLAVGDLVRLVDTDSGWVLRQLPQVQSALVALSPKDGAVRALVGGFNFNLSKFNRVTQGVRQPGSNFKPFVYTAALASGFTPASLINDAPVVFEDDNLESSWRPENYSKNFFGPTRLREALYRSRNLVSIRILRRVGVRATLDYISRFGFDRSRLPNNLSLALGSADVTPLELVSGYAVMANGGFKVEPYWLDRIEDRDGELVFQAAPKTLCEGCRYQPPLEPDALEDTLADTLADILNIAEFEAPGTQDSEVTSRPLAVRVVDKQTAYLITNILQDVIKRGSGRRARVLDRDDLAGKTGTTNDLKDAWFSGFNPGLVASVWVGFDQPQTLGRNEYGSRAALPIWIDFMGAALEGVPEAALIPPEGIVSVRIDPVTGLLAYPGQEDAIFEVFREQDVPSEAAVKKVSATTRVTAEELF
ncbi:MAG: penicillin-binding protein 1A [Motiliproteus sp.]|jgi:penicillin-binding protein 1A